MIRLAEGGWLAVNTRFARDQSTLVLHRSTDGARTWVRVGEVVEAGRFLDNGELVQLPDGSVLLTGRSVIEATSFRLPVYRSTDSGRSWSYRSNIDGNEGEPRTLKGRGLWEPHFFQLGDGRLAVAYANEKHAPTFSQVCSLKVSTDRGQTWGPEITLAEEKGGGRLRPGMPVVERMTNGSYIAVYEVVGVGDADVYYKFSTNGVTWPEGLGAHLPDHHAAPWVTSLDGGRLLLTSCANVLSCSDDLGQTWHRLQQPAWDLGPGKHFTWPAIYQVSTNEIAVMVAWRGVHLRFGTLSPPLSLR